MLNRVNEFLACTFTPYFQTSFFDCDIEIACVKGPDEYDFLCALADVDKATCARQFRTEFADVEIALPICLRKTEKRDIQPASIVKVELIRLVDNGLGIRRRAEVQTARRDAADDTRLGRHRKEIDDLLLVGDTGNTFRHADTEVDNAVRHELECSAPRNDLSCIESHRRQRRCDNTKLTGKRS